MGSIRQFTSNALLYLLANSLGAALPFLLLPFLTRELGALEYGKVGLLSSVYTLVLTVAGLGTFAYVRSIYYQCAAEERKLILGNSIVLVAVSSLLILLFLWLLDSVIQLPLPMLYVVIGVVSVFGQNVISIKLAIWQMAGKPIRYGTVSVLMVVQNLAFSLLLVFAIGMQAEGRLLGMWLPAVIVGLAIVAVMRSNDEVRFSLSPATISRILDFGLPLIPHSLALSLVTFVERSALSKNADTSLLGIFFVAYQMSLPVTILANSVNLQFRSWSDRLMAGGEHRAVVAGSYMVMGALLMAALFYAWLLQFFFSTIVGRELASGYPVSVILILSAMLRGFYLVVAKGLFFSGRTRLLMKLTLALSLVFSATLLFFDDLYTVAFLDLAFNFLLFISVWLASARVYPQPWFSLGSLSSRWR